MSSAADTTVPKPFVFVLMPFDPAFSDIYKFGIKGAASEVGAYAERVDEQIFTQEGILERIFNQINKADVIVADMTERNPNVFYEVGYAHALGKIVLLVTQNADDIPFDLKHRQHTVYEGKIDQLREDLVAKLRWAISESQKPTRSDQPPPFSLRINGVPAAPGIIADPTIEVTGTITGPFRIPVHLRNDSFEPLIGISHVYLFAADSSIAVPYEVKFDWLAPTLGEPQSQPKIGPLAGFAASGIDAGDGLTQQYRLTAKIEVLPPGAIEEIGIPMMLLGDASMSADRFRLRVHTATAFVDYCFKLNVQRVQVTK